MNLKKAKHILEVDAAEKAAVAEAQKIVAAEIGIEEAASEAPKEIDSFEDLKIPEVP